MSPSSRRRFLQNVGKGFGTAAFAGCPPVMASVSNLGLQEPQTAHEETLSPPTAIDFRYSPLSWQTAFCFPDDPHKNVMGERGELRYGHPGQGRGPDYFPEIVEFSLLGMEANQLGWQELEAPGIPIVHTRLDRPEAFLHLISFATERQAEGRVDNVILEIESRTQHQLAAVPLVILKTKREAKLQNTTHGAVLRLGDEKSPPFLLSDTPFSDPEVGGLQFAYPLQVMVASSARPCRCFLRFPQEGQCVERLAEGLGQPEELLSEAREYWQNWKPFGGQLSLQIPGQPGNFLTACARNIQQAREVKAGRLTFQVGPTCYRGLWVVDGNFLLEAARYLGYDAAAQEGLEATWAHQEASGGVFAGGGPGMWKDTGIAMFTLVRQAELSQDWSYFHSMQPSLTRAVNFLKSKRDEARTDGSVNGRYGLLAPGMGDGGLYGIFSEFTNTVWALAGLKALTEAMDRQGLPDPAGGKVFYAELRAALSTAARQEMVRHPDGFDYLPMLVKEEALWKAPHEWDRPRPQTAQWALSHAIYPGLVFAKDDPVVQGHIRLMQSCTQEDIPAETGWLPHGGVWNYNAGFVAQVYLWAGLADWARSCFIGYLNHASPLYCWREEQPMRGSLTATYNGDMPHNWASAECVRYLRHMLALEDGRHLRLLAGLGEPELRDAQPITVVQSPTRFGRVDLKLEPLDRHEGWRLWFQRSSGPDPETVNLPATLGARRFSRIVGAVVQQEGNNLLVAPGASSWEVTWKQ